MIDFDIKSYIKTVLPSGEYTFRIKNPEIKPTKSCLNGLDDSKFLSIALEVVSEFRRGEIIYDNFNLYHSKETVCRIARQQFAALCDALDMTAIKEYGELHAAIVKAIVS